MAPAAEDVQTTSYKTPNFISIVARKMPELCCCLTCRLLRLDSISRRTRKGRLIRGALLGQQEMSGEL